MTRARPRDGGKASAGPAEVLHQYLSFRVGAEEYAAPILRVREIIRFDVLTRVPSAPLTVRGVINVRGQVVPVVDLALKFGLPPCEVSPLTCIVIVEVTLNDELVPIGLLVDAVRQTLELRGEDIEPPPPFGTRARAELLEGLGRSGKKFVLLLDLARLLSLEELAEVPSGPGQ